MVQRNIGISPLNGTYDLIHDRGEAIRIAKYYSQGSIVGRVEVFGPIVDSRVHPPLNPIGVCETYRPVTDLARRAELTDLLKNEFWDGVNIKFIED